MGFSPCHIYVTWRSGKTTKSNKRYYTSAEAGFAANWLVEHFGSDIRVVELR